MVFFHISSKKNQKIKTPQSFFSMLEAKHVNSRATLASPLIRLLKKV
jgi:hypothetical protein